MSTFRLLMGLERLRTAPKGLALGELAELGFGTPTKVLGGGALAAALVYLLYKSIQKRQNEAAEHDEETRRATFTPGRT